MGGAATTWRAQPGTPTWRRSGTAPWVVAGAIVLLLGLAAALVHPALGLAVVGLLTSPVFVVAPHRALLLFAAVVPFDAVSALESEGAVTLTRVLGLALLGGWMVFLVANHRRVVITRTAWLFAAYAGLAALSLAWAADAAVTL